MLLLLKELKNI